MSDESQKPCYSGEKALAPEWGMHKNNSRNRSAYEAQRARIQIKSHADLEKWTRELECTPQQLAQALQGGQPYVEQVRQKLYALKRMERAS